MLGVWQEVVVKSLVTDIFAPRSLPDGVKPLIVWAGVSRDLSLEDLAGVRTVFTDGRYTAVASGGVRGGGKIGERVGDDLGVPVYRFPADWKRYGAKAGRVRDEYMVIQVARSAGGLFVFPDSGSARNILRFALQYGVTVYAERVDLGDEPPLLGLMSDNVSSDD